MVIPTHMGMFVFQDLRDLENDDLNVQLDIFEEHKDDDFLEFQHRWRDISLNFEYPFPADFSSKNIIRVEITCCSKPWAIAQAFCSKSANFRPLRIHPKSTQTVAQAVTNHSRTVLEAFQRVRSDFQDLPKSAMFKTMGYSPGLLLEIGRFSTLPNSP